VFVTSSGRQASGRTATVLAKDRWIRRPTSSCPYPTRLETGGRLPWRDLGSPFEHGAPRRRTAVNPTPASSIVDPKTRLGSADRGTSAGAER
jgi:hypothetical protein